MFCEGEAKRKAERRKIEENESHFKFPESNYSYSSTMCDSSFSSLRRRNPPFLLSTSQLDSASPGLQTHRNDMVPVILWLHSITLFYRAFPWLPSPLNFSHFETEQTPSILFRGRLISVLCLFHYSLLRAKNPGVCLQFRSKVTAVNSSWNCVITQETLSRI